jgi:hypothetical protein
MKKETFVKVPKCRWLINNLVSLFYFCLSVFIWRVATNHLESDVAYDLGYFNYFKLTCMLLQLF